MRAPWLLAAGLLIGVTAPGSAQVHRSRAPTVASVREEYLEQVATGTNETLERLKRAFLADRVDDWLRQFTPGGLYSPPTGESHYGAEAIRTVLQRRMQRFGGMTLTRTDWTASGSLAYLFGRYYYGPTHEGGQAEQGTYVMVLLQEGRDWRIRSYVERQERGTPGDGGSAP